MTIHGFSPDFFFRFQRVQGFRGKDVILGVYVGGSEVH